MRHIEVQYKYAMAADGPVHIVYVSSGEYVHKLEDISAKSKRKRDSTAKRHVSSFQGERMSCESSYIYTRARLITYCCRRSSGGGAVEK